MNARPQRPRTFNLLVGLAIGLVIGSVTTGVVWATVGGSAEVRVAARVLDDGRVEVGLQQRTPAADGADGSAAREWGAIERPDLRFVPADAERGRWLYSSPLMIEASALDAPAVDDDAGGDAGDVVDTTTVEESQANPITGSITDGTVVTTEATESVVSVGPFQIIGLPTGGRPFDDETLFCVITHGNPGDFFWYQVYSGVADASVWNHINVRAEMYEVGTDQAAGIDGCVADGAAAIATTLADSEALLPALERASEAGVRLLTFNSGSDQATAAGSVAHVALDESEVGRIAAAEFTKRDTSGDLLCIVHEPTNRGLEQRCDSLEESYDGGDVIRLRVDASDDVPATIAAAVTDEVGGAIALNANTAYAMSTALSEAHPDVVLSAVSADFPRPMALLATEGLDFVLWSHALEQGYHAITALLFAHGTPFSPDVGLFAEATQITIHPSVITKESVDRLREQGNEFGQTLPAWHTALERAIESELAGPQDQEGIPEVPVEDPDAG